MSTLTPLLIMLIMEVQSRQYADGILSVGWKVRMIIDMI